MAEPANKLTAEMDSRAAVKGRKPSIATRVLAEQLRRDPPGQWTDNRLEQSNHYAGITYIAVKAIMNAIKGCTIRVTKRDRDGARAMLKGGTVTKAMPTMHSQANDHEWVPFTDPGHSLIRLLEKPNPTETIQDILCQVILQYNLTGSGHLWKNPDKLELPCELYVLPTALCQAQPPVPEFPEGWWRVTQYYPSGAFGIMPSPAAGGGSPVDKRQVATLKNPHPLWRWDAFSPLTAGKLQIDILESIDRARWTAMDAGVTPSAMLLAPGLNQQELDAALDRIAENNAGKRNHRKVLGIGGEQGGGADSGGSWSVSFPDAAPKDMDFSSGWDQMVGFDFALFGVPKEAANLSGVSSYSALYASLKQFYALTLRPLCIDLSNWLTRNLAHAWSDDLAIIVDLPPIDGDELIEKQIAVDLQYDLVTYNEMRALRSRPPVDGGDVPVSVYKANALAKAQAEQAKQAKQQQQQGMPAPGGDGGGEGTGSSGGGQESQPEQKPADAVLGALGVSKAYNPLAHPRLHGKFVRKGTWEWQQIQAGKDPDEPAPPGVPTMDNPTGQAPSKDDPRIAAYKYLRTTGKTVLEAVTRAFGGDLKDVAERIDGEDPSAVAKSVHDQAPALAQKFGIDDEEAREILQAALQVMGQQAAPTQEEGQEPEPQPADAGNKPPVGKKTAVADGGGDDGEETKPPFFREQSATGVKSLKKPENKQAVGNMPPKVDKEYQKFACAYIKLEPEYAAYILELGKRVDDHFLADDGREDEPHVTVRYGIHDCEPSDVQKVVEGFGTVQYHLGEVGYFDGKLSGRDYDVVIVKVTSNRLNELHGLLGQLPHTDTHAAYCPHATVAYVKLGMGHIYADIFSKMNVMCETSKMVFSDAKHNKSTISLAMPTRVEKDAMSYLNDSAGGALVPPAGCAKKVRKKKRRRRLARMIANAVTKAVGQPAITGDDVGAAIDALLVEKGYTHAVAKDAKWDEDKHPRDHGKFSSKPGGSGGKSDDSKGSSKSSSKASTGDHSGAVNIADSDNANTDDIGSPNEDDIFAFMDSDPSVRSDDDDKPLTIDADNVESDPNIDDSTLSRQKVALRASPIAKSDSLDRPGANESVKVTLDDGTEAVFKPSEGETFLRVGVPTGGFYKREAAASSVADILGFGDLVPPTTIREHGGRTGSIQKFVPNAKSAFQIKTEAMYDGEEDLSRSAAFDYIIGHSDRHQGNWLLSSEGKLTLIDNGLSFPVRKEASDYWNGQFWPRVIQQQLKIPDLSGLKDKWPQVEDALRQHGLNDDAVALTKQRFDAVVENSGGYFQHLPSLVDDNDQLSHMLVKSNQLVPVAKGKSSSAPIRIS